MPVNRTIHRNSNDNNGNIITKGCVLRCTDSVFKNLEQEKIYHCKCVSPIGEIEVEEIPSRYFYSFRFVVVDDSSIEFRIQELLNTIGYSGITRKY